MTKKANLIVAIFFLFSIVPVISMIFSEENIKLKESLAQKPSIINEENKININYLNEFSSYINDNFHYRDYLITADSYLNEKLFNISKNETVYVGKDGYLFYGENIDSLRGLNKLSYREIFSIYRNIYLLKEYINSKGIDFYFIIAPNKSSVYNELTGLKNINNNKNMERLKKYLYDENLSFIDLSEVFKEKLYYKLDSHWTNKGASLAFDKVMDSIDKKAEKMHEKNPPKTYEHIGDLYEMINPRGKKIEKDLDFEKYFSFSYDEDYKNPQDLVINTTNPKKQGKLLMYRDSFGNYFHKFFANEFKEATFKRAIPYNLISLNEKGI